MPATGRARIVSRSWRSHSNRHAATDPRIPPYDKNVHMGPYEFDCHWPNEAVVLELDGRPYHRALEDRDRDNAKDVWLQDPPDEHPQGQRLPLGLRHRAGAIDDLLALLAIGRRRAA